MASSEEIVRHELHERLTEVVGHHGAAYLMARVPPMEWDHLASKDDVADLKADMADMRTELKADMADMRTELKADMADMRTELKADMADLRTELKAEIADVRAGLGAEIKDLRKDTVHEFAMVRTEMTGVKHEILGAFRAELTAAIGTQARILVVQHVVLFLAFAGFALATR
jgi:hypothetical protein